jgi:hypothetical protein
MADRSDTINSQNNTPTVTSPEEAGRIWQRKALRAEEVGGGRNIMPRLHRSLPTPEDLMRGNIDPKRDDKDIEDWQNSKSPAKKISEILPQAGSGGGGPMGGAPYPEGKEYAGKVRQIESGGNDKDVTGPNVGRYQFSKDQFPGIGMRWEHRFEPEEQDRGLYNQNSQIAQKWRELHNGENPTPAQMYQMHQQGIAGTAAIHDPKNKDKPADEVVAGAMGYSKDKAKEAIMAQTGSKDIAGGKMPTAGQFAEHWNNLYKNAKESKDDVVKTQSGGNTTKPQQSTPSPQINQLSTPKDEPLPARNTKPDPPLQLHGLKEDQAEAMREGAKIAFGDPASPNTRYVISTGGPDKASEGGVGADASHQKTPSMHNQGKAVDVQIWDRQQGKFVGGSMDIDSNAFGNPKTYRHFESLAQGVYQHVLNTKGKEEADQYSWGGRFGHSFQSKPGHMGPDEMHYSKGEEESLRKVTEPASGAMGNSTFQKLIIDKGGMTKGMGTNPSTWRSDYQNEPTFAKTGDADKIPDKASQAEKPKGSDDIKATVEAAKPKAPDNAPKPKESDATLKEKDKSAQAFVDKYIHREIIREKSKVDDQTTVKGDDGKDKRGDKDPKSNPTGSTDKRSDSTNTDKQELKRLSDTKKLQEAKVAPGPNPANPYMNTHEFEYAVVSSSGATDKTKQQRVQISPQSMAGVESQSLPYAKTHMAHTQEAPTWKSPHSYKNGNIVKVRKDPQSGEWEILGNPGTVNA